MSSDTNQRCEDKMFPIQSEREAAPHPTQIPWSIADLAYSVYSARYGRNQSLQKLADRAGFGPGEMDMLLPGWRDMCSETAALKARISELEKAVQVDPRDDWQFMLLPGWRDMCSETAALKARISETAALKDRISELEKAVQVDLRDDWPLRCANLEARIKAALAMLSCTMGYYDEKHVWEECLRAEKKDAHRPICNSCRIRKALMGE